MMLFDMKLLWLKIFVFIIITIKSLLKTDATDLRNLGIPKVGLKYSIEYYILWTLLILPPPKPLSKRSESKKVCSTLNDCELKRKFKSPGARQDP